MNIKFMIVFNHIETTFSLRKTVLLAVSFICLIPMQGFTQSKAQEPDAAIRKTVIGFLKWYKSNGEKIEQSPIVVGYRERADTVHDTSIKNDTVKIDMIAVEQYLTNFKNSNFVSDAFLNDLRIIYANVSKGLQRKPVVNYFGVIGGLEADLIFGFEPEDILDHITEGRFTRIYRVYNRALVKFNISENDQYVFTLSKHDGKWLIDSFGFDRTNYDRKVKHSSN